MSAPTITQMQLLHDTVTRAIDEAYAKLKSDIQTQTVISMATATRSNELLMGLIAEYIMAAVTEEAIRSYWKIISEQ